MLKLTIQATVNCLYLKNASLKSDILWEISYEFRGMASNFASNL